MGSDSASRDIIPVIIPSEPHTHATSNPSDAIPTSSTPKRKSNLVELVVSWNARKYSLSIPIDSTVGEVKLLLSEVTSVLPKRQKIMGLVKGRLPEDDAVLENLPLKYKGSKVEFMMIGTPEANIIKDPSECLDLPDVLNDLDCTYIDYFPDDEGAARDPKNRERLRSAIEKTEIRIINPLREGKRLLVLDLDYTIFDCKSPANHIGELVRPGTHLFLAAAYEHYDIVIWSQTKLSALEAKITEMGLLTSPHYKIAFVLDITSMFSISTLKSGKTYRHQVKALEVIWTKLPRYSARNTIHVDDLSRNFAMNPKCGLKITAFKNGPLTRHLDRELFFLARYLLSISRVEDFRTLNHKRWKKYKGMDEFQGLLDGFDPT
ncbi:uncharacterized protein VTP21DRAFT_255 [Calcarisporiella thermophila]|uniref:uncharacterized protein n=1 Tax=Calcarisporiella thermophila TaxID=911321 RepID=UPI00374371DF